MRPNPFGCHLSIPLEASCKPGAQETDSALRCRRIWSNNVCVASVEPISLVLLPVVGRIPPLGCFSPPIFLLSTSGSRPVVATVAVDCRTAAHLQAQLAYFPSCRGLILDRRSPCLQRCLRSSFIQQQVNAILKLVPYSLPRAPLCHKLLS